MRELDLLHHIYASNQTLPENVVIPPGDDMGAIDIAGQTVLITVDQLADQVHFDLSSTTLEKIARKAITRNLSDVAAMGAFPAGAVAAACLPQDFTQPRGEQLFNAMRLVAESYHCPLIGGDISIWDGRLIITVTIFARMADETRPLLRQGAQPGDAILVSGLLGGSLETINQYTHHLDFQPRIALGQLLAKHPTLRPHCMIDLSDGLATDLDHLCNASTPTHNLGAEIDLASLPISPAARQASQRTGRPAWDHALRDGEDYELCFTAPPDHAAALCKELTNPNITPVGRITTVAPTSAQSRIELIHPDGTRQPLTDAGWEHHSDKS